MNTPAQDTPSPQSLEHLRMLGIGYYVFAAFGVLGLLFVAGHFVFMQSVMDMGGAEGGPSTQFQWMMLLGYVGIALLLAGWIALNLIAARSLRDRRRWLLCVIVAAIDSLHVPLGTVLGVLTLIVLNQPGVRRSFD